MKPTEAVATIRDWIASNPRQRLVLDEHGNGHISVRPWGVETPLTTTHCWDPSDYEAIEDLIASTWPGGRA